MNNQQTGIRENRSYNPGKNRLIAAFKFRYFPKSTDPPVKNVPATAAVIRHARVAAMSALRPTLDRSFVL